MFILKLRFPLDLLSIEYDFSRCNKASALQHHCILPNSLNNEIKIFIQFFYCTRKQISQSNQISPTFDALFNFCVFFANTRLSIDVIFPIISLFYFLSPNDSHTPACTSDNNPVDMIHRKILFYIANCAKSTDFSKGNHSIAKRESFKRV